jgi:hypothetical protein
MIIILIFSFYFRGGFLNFSQIVKPLFNVVNLWIKPNSITYTKNFITDKELQSS